METNTCRWTTDQLPPTDDATDIRRMIRSSSDGQISRPTDKSFVLRDATAYPLPWSSPIGMTGRDEVLRVLRREATCHLFTLSSNASKETYFSLLYSALACCRTGMSGSASFQRFRNRSYSARALAVSCWSASARAIPRCASAPRGSFITMPG